MWLFVRPRTGVMNWTNYRDDKCGMREFQKKRKQTAGGWETVLLISVVLWLTPYSGANIAFNSRVSEIKRWYISTTRAKNNKGSLAEGSERGFTHTVSLNLIQFFIYISASPLSHPSKHCLPISSSYTIINMYIK